MSRLRPAGPGIVTNNHATIEEKIMSPNRPTDKETAMPSKVIQADQITPYMIGYPISIASKTIHGEEYTVTGILEDLAVAVNTTRTPGGSRPVYTTVITATIAGIAIKLAATDPVVVFADPDPIDETEATEPEVTP